MVMDSPREIIERIRRKKFAVGLHTTDDEWLEYAQETREMMHRAVEQLSQDLYSKEMHFVLELIQNADDNEYPDGVEPTLHFIIEPSFILIRNNEIGFNERNVQAICDVGKSTKDRKATRGYIGEKGIGFKSVFRVSPEPHIFSNRFQFKFKDKDEEFGLGYIIPYWVDDIPQGVILSQTNIFLPFRGETPSALMEISDIEDPTLLLFLRRLKQISIENRIANISFEMIRTDLYGRIVLWHAGKQYHWKLVKKIHNVPDTLIEEKREGIRQTEMALAFPLRDDLSAETNKRPPVFAFLPTKEYGFRFIIHADFLLTTNREDIQKDKKWNLWLRDKIAPSFLSAVDEFKADEHIKTTFYNFIPVNSDINDKFFKPVVDRIHRLLKDAPCILTTSGKWVEPGNIIKADKKIMELIQEDELRIFFRKSYLPASLKIRDDVREALKISRFTLNDLIGYLRNEDWIKKQSDEWFKKLFEYLGRKIDDQLTEDHVKTLRGLNILKLESGDIVCVKEANVFFPLDKTSKYGFEKQIPLLNRGVCTTANEKIQEEIELFLERLGVRKASPYEIIQKYMFPLFEREDEEQNWQSKSEEFLVGCTQFIRDNFDHYRSERKKAINAEKESSETKEDPLKDLREKLWLKTTQSNRAMSVYDSPENIYLSGTYSTENEFEKLFAGIDGISYLHKIYLEDSRRQFAPTKRSKLSKRQQMQRSAEKERDRWKRFFTAIGVSEGFKIKQISTSHLSSTEKAQLRLKEWGDTNCTTEYEQNYDIQHLDDIVDRIKNNPERSALLFETIQRQWNFLREYSQLSYDWEFRRRRRGPAKTDATWLHTLKTREWLLTSGNKLVKPYEVYIDKSETRRLLGDSVHYISVENEEFADSIGINFEVTVKGVLSNLSSLHHTANEDLDAFIRFYKFLYEHFDEDPNFIKESFEEVPLIFIPETTQKYFGRDQVVWRDLTNIFGDTFGYLEKQYVELKEFFVGKLGISERPRTQDYANALLILSKKDSLGNRDKEVIYTIYRHLNAHLDPDQVEVVISEAEWWEDFSEDRILWTDVGEFRTRFNVYVNDHEGIYQSFKGKPGISFLKLPARSYQKYRHLISALEIPYLSEAVTSEIALDDNAKEETELTEQLNDLLPYIFRYLYRKANSAYVDFKRKHSIGEPWRLSCYSLKKLLVVYELAGQRAIVEQQAKYENSILYVQEDCVGSVEYLSVEFAKLFGNPAGLDSFLMTLLLREKDKRKNSLKAMNIPDLPEEDLDWFAVVTSTSYAMSSEAQEEEEEEETERRTEKVAISHNGQRDGYGEQKEEGTPRVGDREGEREGIQESGETASEVQSPLSGWFPEISPGVGGDEIDVFESEFSTPRKSVARDTMEISSVDDNEMRDDNDGEKLSNKAKKAIGRWGEEEVFCRLRKELIRAHPDARPEDNEDRFCIVMEKETLAELLWLNKVKDTGVGHDIVLIKQGVKEYIEVKATKTDKKEWFDLSPKQWELANEHKERFHIYRVYNAGTPNARVVAVDNPRALWEQGKLRVYAVIQL